MHSISLPPGEFGGDDVLHLFLGTLDCSRHPFYEGLRGLRVSAHFLIRRDGQPLQFVSCDRRAWHAGASSWRGVPACNDRSIGIEMEGLEGDGFTAPQYRAAGHLLRVLSSRYPVRDVVGHEHVAPMRKRDPGAGFDWAGLGRAIRSAEPHVWPLLAIEP